jgi:hypothetical protein
MKAIGLLLVTALATPQIAHTRVARDRTQGQVEVRNRSADREVHQTNVNRDVNRNVNRDVNVNREVNIDRDVDVDVHGGYYGRPVIVEDDDWGWGSFAAGAAVGVATTAAVAAATRPDTVVVAGLAVGTVVTALPAGCSSGSTMVYNCSNVFYRPFYQGTTLVYQVVTGP